MVREKILEGQGNFFPQGILKSDVCSNQVILQIKISSVFDTN